MSKKKDELNKKNLELKKKFKETAQSLNNKVFNFKKESKDNGELYGSIKPKEISTEIFKKMKLDVKPSQIVLKEELNKIGKFTTEIKFHSEVSAKITIKIDKDPVSITFPQVQKRCVTFSLLRNLFFKI